MKLKTCVTVVVFAAVFGCGSETMLKSNNDKDRAKRLEQELSNKEALIKSQSTELGERNAKLNEVIAKSEHQDAELRTLGTQIEERTLAVEAANKRIAEQEAKVAEIRKKIDEYDTEVADLTKELEAQSDALKVANTANDELIAKQAELARELQMTIEAREKAMSDLREAAREKAVMKKILTDYQGKSVQVFLENAGPETMFGASGTDLAEFFPRRDNKCAVVLDLGPDLEIVRGPERSRLPQFEGYSVLPMRIGYRKIAVCDDGNKLEAQVDIGQVYKIFGDSQVQLLVGARTKSTCDKQNNDMKSNNILGAESFQTWSPFRGEIDGIETMDIPAQGGNIRLHMGSALISAASCPQAILFGDKNDLITLACMVLRESEIEGKKVSKGCFAKKSSWGRMNTVFSPE